MISRERLTRQALSSSCLNGFIYQRKNHRAIFRGLVSPPRPGSPNRLLLFFAGPAGLRVSARAESLALQFLLNLPQLALHRLILLHQLGDLPGNLTVSPNADLLPLLDLLRVKPLLPAVLRQLCFVDS